MRQVFSAFPASDAFDSIILARLTYARALPLPPSSYCPLFLFLHLLFKKGSRQSGKLFQSCPVSKALSFLVAGVTYLYEGVTATSIVVLSFMLL